MPVSCLNERKHCSSQKFRNLSFSNGAHRCQRSRHRTRTSRTPTQSTDAHSGRHTQRGEGIHTRKNQREARSAGWGGRGPPTRRAGGPSFRRHVGKQVEAAQVEAGVRRRVEKAVASQPTRRERGGRAEVVQRVEAEVRRSASVSSHRGVGLWRVANCRVIHARCVGRG